MFLCVCVCGLCDAGARPQGLVSARQALTLWSYPIFYFKGIIDTGLNTQAIVFQSQPLPLRAVTWVERPRHK